MSAERGSYIVFFFVAMQPKMESCTTCTLKGGFSLWW